MTDLMSSVDASFKMYMDSNGQNIEAGLVFRRSIDVLNAIIKEFASVKMPSGIKIMSQVSRLYSISTIHQ